MKARKGPAAGDERPLRPRRDFNKKAPGDLKPRSRRLD